MKLAEDVDALLDRSGAPRKRPEDVFAPWREEIRGYARQMQEIRNQHPDDAMGWLSTVSARVLELVLATTESDGRAATKFRIDELIPVRDECRFQFQVASRRQSVSELDWKVAGGQPS